MKNFKMKDLLVSIYPGEAENQHNRLTPQGHFHENGKCTQPSKALPEAHLPKCTQPSKAVPFAVVLQGPTRASNQPAGIKEAPCPCPSKTASEDAGRLPNMAPENHLLPHQQPSGASALAELKKALARMQAKAETLQ